MAAFKYCPFLWIFFVVKLHGRNLHRIYEMQDASFEDLLSKGNFCTVHEKNIHTLLIKICKSINNIRPAIMSDFSNLTLISVEGGEEEGVVLPPC